MADYRAMYALLFHKISSVVEELQSVQQQAEAMFISSESPKMRLISSDDQKDKKSDKSY